MTDDATATSGSPDNASGAGDPGAATEPVTTQPKKDTVAYDSYRKVLSEKKRTQEKYDTVKKQLDELLEKQKAAEDQAAEERGEFKKLWESEKEKAEKLEQTIASFNDQHRRATKLAAFLRTLDGTLDDKYFGLVPTDDIAVDPDTGDVDDNTVTKAVEKFKAEHHRLIDKPGGQTGLPNTAPRKTNAPTGLHEMSAQEIKASLAADLARGVK